MRARLGIGVWVAVMLVGVIGQDAWGQTTKTVTAKEKREEARKQFVGWYEADKGRELIVLPEKKKLMAVFNWANGAPTSMGELVVAGSGKVTFKQPKASEQVVVHREDGQVTKVSVVEVEFAKVAGLEAVLGKYVNEKGQTMEITWREGEVYMSIDWQNNAPKTNGLLRASPNGGTMLVGYQWEDKLTLKFEKGSVASISIVDSEFKRVKDPDAATEVDASKRISE
jgi:hypothetical protein